MKFFHKNSQRLKSHSLILQKMLHLRSFTGFSIHLECWNAFRFGQSNKFWKKSLDIQGCGLWRSSRGRPESTSQGRPLNVRLRRPLDVISGRPQDVRLRRPREVRSGRPRDDQIGSLGDVLETLEGDALGTNICRLGYLFAAILRLRKQLLIDPWHGFHLFYGEW